MVPSFTFNLVLNEGKNSFCFKQGMSIKFLFKKQNFSNKDMAYSVDRIVQIVFLF